MTHGPVAMTPEEHLLLNEVIERQFGLSFAPAKKEFLESRLRPRLQSLHLRRFIDYYLLLQVDLDSELEHLARLITNNETYFFREVYQFEGLFAEGLGELRQAGWSGELRMLCAGCSSGEEPYTLNIYARQAGLVGGRWAIDAFDIDVDRLKMAREAIYGVGSLRSTSEAQRAQYFSGFAADRWQLRRANREGVGFAYGNILDLDSFRKPQAYDAIFCRNVLIYFSEGAFQHAVANFARALRLGGLLFLGHSESLIGRSDRFETVRLERCIAYRKLRD
ncbi:MAG TPA: CheR family methyltransferase [Thermoanaerobaculia bacterium]|jgi:chemotaxis protein methyltransferase CheR|nr:CheR family methyltransferase [Thermoanaerobaculia bacterium]